MTQKRQNLPARPIGRPPVTPKLTEALFVRTNLELIQGLDKLVERERQAHPGRIVTRANIIRDILYQAVENYE